MGAPARHEPTAMGAGCAGEGVAALTEGATTEGGAPAEGRAPPDANPPVGGGRTGLSSTLAAGPQAATATASPKPATAVRGTMDIALWYPGRDGGVHALPCR
jgi:hypothetical protein